MALEGFGRFLSTRLLKELMEVGHSGEAGAAAPSHVAPDGKHACALAIILLHLGVAQIVEESAPNLAHATLTIVL